MLEGVLRVSKWMIEWRIKQYDWSMILMSYLVNRLEQESPTQIDKLCAVITRYDENKHAESFFLGGGGIWASENYTGRVDFESQSHK